MITSVDDLVRMAMVAFDLTMAADQCVGPVPIESLRSVFETAVRERMTDAAQAIDLDRAELVEQRDELHRELVLLTATVEAQQDEQTAHRPVVAGTLEASS